MTFFLSYSIYFLADLAGYLSQTKVSYMYVSTSELCIRFCTVFVCSRAKVILSFFLAVFFRGCTPQHMEVPKLGVEKELQLLAYTAGPATSNEGSELRL